MECQQITMPVDQDDLGTLRGIRFFTSCRVIRNGVFRLDDHVDRLFHCASRLFLTMPLDRNGLKALINECISKNESQLGVDGMANMKVIISGGKSDGSGFMPSGAAHVYILMSLLPPYSNLKGLDAVKLGTFPYQRDWPDIKFTCYIGGYMGHRHAVTEKGAHLPLFVTPDDHRFMLEGSTFNFFAVKKGTVLTYPTDGRILPGITRKVVLEVCDARKVPISETPLRLNDIKDCDEAFITSSTRDILPVSQVNDHRFGAAPGPVTARLADYVKNIIYSR